LTADPRSEKKSSGQNARRPGRDHLVTGGGIIQESLGAIIPLQTGGFVGIGTHGEHDFGAVDEGGVRYFWKVDCFDRNTEFGSPDPADPAVTTRVLTIMRADEYRMDRPSRSLGAPSRSRRTA
jgi:hypothetical protein